jgi:hypothetical protein
VFLPLATASLFRSEIFLPAAGFWPMKMSAAEFVGDEFVDS